jgi:cell shape-determining protein MreD
MTVRPVAAVAAMITAMVLQAALIAPLAQPVPVSLPAVLVAVVALVDGPGVGMAFGFAAGLVADLGSSHPAGVLALTWTGLGLVCGVAASGRSSRADARTIALCCTVAASIATALLAVVHAGGIGFWPALRDTLPTWIGDFVLALLVLPLARRMLRSEMLRAVAPVPGEQRG